MGGLTAPGDLSGYERHERERRSVLVRPEWRDALLDDLFADFATVPPSARKVYSHGRVQHFSYRPERAPARVFVRRAARGGAIGALLRGLYAGTERPLVELRAAARARDAGVGVPDPVAVLADRVVGPFCRLTVVSREVEGGADLLSLAGSLDPRAKRDLIRRVADEMRRLHEAGVYHSDLTLKNVLVAGPSVYILDLDKARLPGRREPALDVANLSRLNRSVEKLFGGRGPITRTDKLRFLRRYLGTRDGLREFSVRCGAGMWKHRLWWAVTGA